MSNNQKPKLIEDLGKIYLNPKDKYKKYCYLCECSKCNVLFKIIKYSYDNRKTSMCKSCSASIGSTRHGLNGHILQNSWQNQKGRCNKLYNDSYEQYGARGIKFSKEFLDFKVWLDYIESLEFAYKKGYTIDRIDNDGNYERGNLRWATQTVQSRHTRILYNHNTSGYRGVSYTTSGKFRAYIKIKRKQIHLGTHETKIDAAKAFDKYILDNDLEHTPNGVL